MSPSKKAQSLQPTDSLPENGKTESCITETHVHSYDFSLLPDQLLADLEDLASTCGTTVADLIVKFAKLGVVAARLKNSGGSLVIRRPGLQDELLTIIV